MLEAASTGKLFGIKKTSRTQIVALVQNQIKISPRSYNIIITNQFNYSIVSGEESFSLRRKIFSQESLRQVSWVETRAYSIYWKSALPIGKYYFWASTPPHICCLIKLIDSFTQWKSYSKSFGRAQWIGMNDEAISIKQTFALLSSVFLCLK